MWIVAYLPEAEQERVALPKAERGALVNASAIGSTRFRTGGTPGGPAAGGPGGGLMTKLSELKTASQIAAEELADPEIRREHERTALAHAVAMRVIGYRIDRGLSQTGLARLLSMHQPA